MKDLTRKLLFMFLAPGLALAGSGKISNDLAHVSGNETVEVIARFDHSLDKKSLQKVRAKLINKIKTDGGQKKGDLDLINGALIRIAAKHLAKIADDVSIEYISPNRMLAPALEKAVPTTGADIAQDYGWNGAGVGVAIIDSGVGGDWPAKDGTTRTATRAMEPSVRQASTRMSLPWVR